MGCTLGSHKKHRETLNSEGEQEGQDAHQQTESPHSAPKAELDSHVAQGNKNTSGDVPHSVTENTNSKPNGTIAAEIAQTEEPPLHTGRSKVKEQEYLLL